MVGIETYEMTHDGEEWRFDVIEMGEDLCRVQIVHDIYPIEWLNDASEWEMVAWAEEQGEDFYGDFISQVLGQLS